MMWQWRSGFATAWWISVITLAVLSLIVGAWSNSYPFVNSCCAVDRLAQPGNNSRTAFIHANTALLSLLIPAAYYPFWNGFAIFSFVGGSNVQRAILR
jgi:hypothetical protein